MIRRPPRSTPLSLHDALPIWDKRFFESTRGRIVTLLRRSGRTVEELARALGLTDNGVQDRKSTPLNSSHANISYAVFCLKKKKNLKNTNIDLTYYHVTRRLHT